MYLRHSHLHEPRGYSISVTLFFVSRRGPNGKPFTCLGNGFRTNIRSANSNPSNGVYF